MARTNRRKTNTMQKKEKEVGFEWIGEGKSWNELTFYTDVKHGDLQFSLGDVVLLQGNDSNYDYSGDYMKSWIAEIEALWEDRNGNRWMENRWLYAVNDFPAAVRPEYRKRELFETDHICNNPIESIIEKVVVHSYKEWSGMAEEERNRCFFCESIFSVKTSYLRQLYDGGESRKKERIYLYSYYSGVYNEQRGKRSFVLSKPSKKRKENQASDQLDYAKERLMLSYIPAKIPCREKEHNEILKYLEYSIENKGNGNPLYISGMPGTGKTATVREVIGELKEKYEFDYFELNGMKVTSANSVFSMMLHHITHKYTMASKAAEALNTYFEKPKRNYLPLVILADELDYLFTKSQQVIYKLFEWPNLPKSHLIVIGISNTIDLPERIMSIRNISRLSMNRVMFKPYNRVEIATIIQTRLEELKVFSNEAIDLCSRKISAVSGDIRRALSIARRGIEIALERNETLVSIEIISEAAKEHTESYKMSLLQHCSSYQVLLLISIVLHMHAIGVDFVLVYDVYKVYVRMNALVVKYLKRQLLYPELTAVCGSLQSVGILSIIPPSVKYDTLLKLNIQIDDITYALRDNEYAKKEIGTLS